MLRKFSVRILSLVLSALILISSIFPSIAYAGYKEEKDYKFVYDAKYLSKNYYLNPLEQDVYGYFMKASEYDKIYKKKHLESLKLTRPVQPEEPEKVSSVLKASTVKKFKESLKNSVYKKNNVEELKNSNGIDLTNHKFMKKINLELFQYLYEQTGIKTNEKYFEEMISNTLQYIDGKMMAQIDNKNNPYRETIKDIRERFANAFAGNKYYLGIAICHWLFHGGKYKPESFKESKEEDVYFYQYNPNYVAVPYHKIMYWGLPRFKNGDVKVLGFIGRKRTFIDNSYSLVEIKPIYDEEGYLIDEIYELEEHKRIMSSYVYASSSGKNIVADEEDKGINAELKEVQKYYKGLLNNKDRLKDVGMGHDRFYLAVMINGDYYEATVCYYEGEFVLYDLDYEENYFMFGF